MTGDQEPRRVAERELEMGERLLWFGRPNAARIGTQSLLLWLFGIPWTIFSLAWTWGASGFGAAFAKPGPQLLFALFGVPFVLVGLAIMAAPFYAYIKGKNTVYAVTNQRVMVIVTHRRGRTVQSFAPDEIGDFERTERSDGTGDLVFCRQHRVDSDGDRTTTKHSFCGIERVREIEGLLRATFVEHKTAA